MQKHELSIYIVINKMAFEHTYFMSIQLSQLKTDDGNKIKTMAYTSVHIK